MNGRTAQVVGLVWVLAVPACGGDAGAGGDRVEGEVLVFAASSLTEAFTDVGERFESEHPETRVTFNFASSSDLAVQIVEGAPADVYASADRIQMDVVGDQGLAENPVDFVANRLVIVTPADNPGGVGRPDDLTRPGVTVVLAAPDVPAGNYARQAFAQLGIQGDVERNVVSNEDDVKQVVAKVQLGEADAGVVYATDITSEVAGDVAVVEFPAGTQVEVVYPITVVTEAPNAPGADAFYDFVLSQEGQDVLREHDFRSP